MNDIMVRDFSKTILNEPVRQELPAGSPRRYEPDTGVRKHNERIHRESKYADDWKNLPFSFKKARKPFGGSVVLRCDNCGHITTGTTATVGIICDACKKFSSVTEITENDR